MKRLFFVAVISAFIGAPAVADMVGGPVYYNSSDSLYRIGDMANVAGTEVGPIMTLPAPMTDIAFDTDGQLYGITFSNLYSIDVGSKTTTNLGAVTYPANALANYDTNKFYLAVDSTGTGGTAGYFVLLDISSGISLTAIDQYYDFDNEFGQGAGIRLDFVSAGDIWVASDGTVYATVNTTDLTAGYLVTVDPLTAEVDQLASLPSNDMYGLAEANGTLYLFRNGGNNSIYTWDGLSLVDTGINTKGSTYGATAVPVPAAVVLGLLGLGVVGLKLRKYA